MFREILSLIIMAFLTFFSTATCFSSVINNVCIGNINSGCVFAYCMPKISVQCQASHKNLENYFERGDSYIDIVFVSISKFHIQI